MTHTPGPWAYSKTSGRILGKVRRHPQSAELGVEMESVPVVAYVRGHHGQQEADDNGMILAASLELLDALEAMIATVDRAKGRPITFHEGMRECSATKARAAIAKARGE